jgi:hypothetical protein
VLNAAGPIVSDPWGRDQLGAEVRGIRLVCTGTRACNGASVLRDIARLAARLRERPVSFTFRVGADRVRARLDALAQVVFASGKSRIESRIGAGVLRKESDKSRYPEESSPTTVASCRSSATRLAADAVDASAIASSDWESSTGLNTSLALSSCRR